jgi:hypothetical protein
MRGNAIELAMLGHDEPCLVLGVPVVLQQAVIVVELIAKIALKRLDEGRAAAFGYMSEDEKQPLGTWTGQGHDGNTPTYQR